MVIIIPTNLFTSWLSSPSFPFAITKNKNEIFSKLVIWKQKLFLLFNYSELHSSSKAYRVQYTSIKEFSHMIFLFILNLFFILLIILPKLVHMGWKFKGTLKSSISFIFKGIFKYLTHFITHTLKETRNSYFCVTPKNHRLMFFSWKILKSSVIKKVIVCFDNLGEENF